MTGQGVEESVVSLVDRIVEREWEEHRERGKRRWGTRVGGLN